MTWFDAFMILLTSCGIGLNLIVLRALWKATGDYRRQRREQLAELSPEERRRHQRWTRISLALAAAFGALLIGSYALGAHAWGQSTGIAVVVFEYVGVFFLCMLGVGIGALVRARRHRHG